MAGNTNAVMIVLLLSLAVLQTMAEGDKCDCEALNKAHDACEILTGALIETVEKSKEEIDELQKQLTGLKTRNAELQKTDDKHEKKTDKNDMLISKLRSKNIELKNKSIELEEDRNILKKKNEQQEKKIQKLQQIIDDLQVKQKSLSKGKSNDTNCTDDTEYNGQNKLSGDQLKELKEVKLELKKVNKTYSELLDKCEPQDQTTKTILPSTPKLKIETKAGKELKKNAPTKTEIKITKHAKVETKKSNVIIKTTQKPTIKSVTVKKSDNFLLYALLAAGSIFAIIIIVYFRKEISGYAKKCLKDDDKGRPASKNYKKLKPNVEESMDVSNRVKDYIY